MELSEQYLLDIIRWGSLTNAAKKLGISQPALSLALTNLEKKLGVVLVDRKNKPVCLTEEGSIYVDYLLKKEELTKQMRKEISDVGVFKKTVLTVGGATVYIESLVADVIPQLSETYPECQVNLRIESLDELIQNGLKGTIDCFVCTDENNIPDDFTLLPIRKERLYLCVPAACEINKQLGNYQVTIGQSKEIEDYTVFAKETFVNLPPTFPLQKRMNRFFEERGMKIHSSITVNQVSTAVALAEKGLGIVVASEEALMSRHLKEQVCLYSLPDEVSGRKIYLAYDSKRYISKACKMFIQLITKGNQNNEIF